MLQDSDEPGFIAASGYLIDIPTAPKQFQGLATSAGPVVEIGQFLQRIQETLVILGIPLLSQKTSLLG